MDLLFGFLEGEMGDSAAAETQDLTVPTTPSRHLNLAQTAAL
jgi:hypothetical protein